ncbi:hypothetical protein N9D23_04610 [Rubripirellula sp.]|jgi:hypothetical protein|nr:hypothetical protein [Planctomycetaceae bacterium]MDA9857379.1 hypothetical protein [Rubripirellula sp.]MDF1842078.1 hypothetical protein [Rubripirellula sp.]
MTRKLLFPLFSIVFASVLCIAGCSTSKEATFTESEDPTAEEETEDEDYMQALEEDMNRMQQQ